MMSKIALGARLLMGLIYLVFGANKFFHFIPMPEMPEAGQQFFGGLMAVGYFMPLLAITEMVVGLVLISGFFVPLALVVIAPVTLNIFLFHGFAEPSGLPMGIALLVFQGLLFYYYKPSYASLLQSK